MNRRWGLKSIVSMALAAMASLLVVPSAVAQDRVGAVAGVVGAEGGTVQGATVKLMRGDTEVATTTTNAEGGFGFRQVPQGRYVVVAFKEGVGRGREAAPVRAGEVTHVRIRLINPQINPGSIRAHVGNDVDGPITEAAVVLMQNGAAVARGSTNNRGVVEFGNLRPGEYTLVAHKDGFTEGRSVVVVRSGAAVETRIVIERIAAPGAIAGVVVSNDARVADAQVTLTVAGRVIATTRTNAEGAYSFPNVRPGTYTVTAVKRGVGRGSAEVTVVSGETARARIALTP